MIRVEGLSFAWGGGLKALEDLSFEVEAGEYLAVLGRNGSGKSSLVRLLNGLELPDKGRVLVHGLDTKDEVSLPAIRRFLQVVFQNPLSQQVGLTVGEDIRFGLANIGLDRGLMDSRAAGALALAGLDLGEDRPVSSLSGGEAQKLALASVLALEPSCLVLDEATAMLDPASREAFLASLAGARARRGFGLVAVSHRAAEVMGADRWLLLDRGRLVALGRPAELWAQEGLLESCGIETPFEVSLSLALADRGIGFDPLARAGDPWEALCASS